MNALREATFIGDYAYYFHRTGRETIPLEEALAIKNQLLIDGLWLLRMGDEGLFVFSVKPTAHWFIEVEEGGEAETEGHLFCRTVFSDPSQSHRYALSQYADLLDVTHHLENDVISMIQSLSTEQAEGFLKRKRFSSFQRFLHTAVTHFRKIHQNCAANHNAPFAFLQEALIYLYEDGDHLRAIEKMDEIYKRIDMQSFEDGVLASSIGRCKGEIQNQLALYVEGIKTLGLAIERNPHNRQAYLEQAMAYFELGDIEKSLASFLNTERSITPIDFEDTLSQEFAAGLIQGILAGGTANAIDFVPSMLSSIRGLSFGLWALVSSPTEVSKELISASQAMIEFIQTHEALDLVQVVIPEIKQLRTQSLSAERKGELFGQIIGRLGTDCLLFAGVSKGMNLYRELRHANAALTLEKMTINLAKREALTKISNDWWKKTSSVIEGIKKNSGKNFDKNLYKAFQNESLSELQVRKILHHCGYKTFPRPKGVPNDATVHISQKNGGMVYVKAGTTKEECILVRVMPGDPTSPNPMQQKPYVVQRRGKAYFTLTEDWVEAPDTMTHLPLETFEFKGW